MMKMKTSVQLLGALLLCGTATITTITAFVPPGLLQTNKNGAFLTKAEGSSSSSLMPLLAWYDDKQQQQQQTNNGRIDPRRQREMMDPLRPPMEGRGFGAIDREEEEEARLAWEEQQARRGRARPGGSQPTPGSRINAFNDNASSSLSKGSAFTKTNRWNPNASRPPPSSFNNHNMDFNNRRPRRPPSTLNGDDRWRPSSARYNDRAPAGPGYDDAALEQRLADLEEKEARLEARVEQQQQQQARRSRGPSVRGYQQPQQPRYNNPSAAAVRGYQQPQRRSPSSGYNAPGAGYQQQPPQQKGAVGGYQNQQPVRTPPRSRRYPEPAYQQQQPQRGVGSAVGRMHRQPQQQPGRYNNYNSNNRRGRGRGMPDHELQAINRAIEERLESLERNERRLERALDMDEAEMRLEELERAQSRVSSLQERHSTRSSQWRLDNPHYAVPDNSRRQDLDLVVQERLASLEDKEARLADALEVAESRLMGRRQRAQQYHTQEQRAQMRRIQNARSQQQQQYSRHEPSIGSRRFNDNNNNNVQSSPLDYGNLNNNRPRQQQQQRRGGYYSLPPPPPQERLDQPQSFRTGAPPPQPRGSRFNNAPGGQVNQQQQQQQPPRSSNGGIRTPSHQSRYNNLDPVPLDRQQQQQQQQRSPPPRGYDDMPPPNGARYNNDPMAGARRGPPQQQQQQQQQQRNQQQSPQPRYNDPMPARGQRPQQQQRVQQPPPPPPRYNGPVAPRSQQQPPLQQQQQQRYNGQRPAQGQQAQPRYNGQRPAQGQQTQPRYNEPPVPRAQQEPRYNSDQRQSPRYDSDPMPPRNPQSLYNSADPITTMKRDFVNNNNGSRQPSTRTSVEQRDAVITREHDMEYESDLGPSSISFNGQDNMQSATTSNTDNSKSRFASRPSSYDPMVERRHNDIHDYATPTTVQGGALQTWWFSDPDIKFVQVSLNTDGCSMDADIQLWQGPDTTPCKMKLFGENGGLRPFTALIATPSGPNTIAIRNTGKQTFPMYATVKNDGVDGEPTMLATEAFEMSRKTEMVRGGALQTFEFGSNVDSVSVLLETNGRPLNAKIELAQGPNNSKQVIELFTEDGMNHPFFAVIATPGIENVVRILNRAPVEHPVSASVEPYDVAVGNVPRASNGVRIGQD